MLKLQETSKRTTLAVSEIEDWDLIVALAHWSYHVHNIDSVHKHNVYKKIYDQSDGYGERGYVPSQGYDWSGIRDSSVAAQKAMAEAARDYLKRYGITHLVISRQSV